MMHAAQHKTNETKLIRSNETVHSTSAKARLISVTIPIATNI